MTNWTGTRTTALGLTLLLCAACGQSEFTGSQSQDIATSEAPAARPRPNARPKAAADKPLISKPIVLPDTPPPAKVELPPPGARGMLLQRLPKSTLLVVRFPHVEKLGEAIARSPLAKLFDDPSMAIPREEMESAFADFQEKMHEEFADAEDLEAQFHALEGELDFALISVDAKILSGHADEVTECPFTCAVMFDAGPHATEFQHLLDRAFASLASELEKYPQTGIKIDVVTDGNETWHRHARMDDMDVEIARDGTQFVLQAGPRALVPSVTAPLPTRPVDDSFAAAHIVRATRDLSKEGALPVLECFVNLDPIWTVMEMFGTPEVKSVLTAAGASSVHGFSTVAGLAETGVDEVMFLDSPDGNDLLTRVLAAHPIDPAIARFLPRDAAASSLGTIDAQALMDGVRKLLPEEEKKSFDEGLDSLAEDGFDLRKDLIANLGPTIGFTGDFEGLARLSEGEPIDAMDITFVVQLKDAARFRQLLDKAVEASPAHDHVRAREMYGYTTSRLDPIPISGVYGGVATTIEPSWCVDEHAFIVSFTNAGLARALAAASQSATEPGPIARALKSDAADAFSISTASKGTSALTIGRRTSLGLEVSTKGGSGATAGYALMGGVALTSAAAVPMLMSGRDEADEATAVSTLQSIKKAELDFRAAHYDDLDRDGDGEFGTLGELTGATGLRCLRPALSRPLLPATMRPDENDCFTLSGYMFRIDVARRTPRNIEDDEREFVAYAWPVSPGMTGRKAFSIDAEGRLWSSDNQGDQQHYAGARRAPGLDAAKRSLSSRPVVGVHGRLGRDGGVWSHAD